MNLAISLKESLSSLQDNVFIHVVLWMVILDILTGLGKSVKEKNLNSSIGLNGLIRHMVILFIVMLVTTYLPIFELGQYSNWINGYFIIMYAISFFENIESMGVPVPSFIKDYVSKMHKTMDESFTITSKKPIEIKVENKEE